MNAPASRAELALVPSPSAYNMAPRNFEEAWRLADMMAATTLVPKDFQRNPEMCFIAMQWGNELGLQPMQSIQNIAVVNGRPSLWGDAMLALVRQSPLCEYVAEEVSGEKAVCRAKRRGQPEQVREFTRADAEKAGLWGKTGPWSNYPKRMLQMRARAWALRDVFTDLLKGLHMAEEAQDAPPAEKFMGAADVVTSAPAAAPGAAAGYPDAKFEENFPKWSGWIAAGRKSAGELIAFVDSAGVPLTEVQKARLNSVKREQPADAPPAAADPFTAPSFAEVANAIVRATTRDALAAAADLIKHVPDAAHQQELRGKCTAREQELA